MTVPVSPPVPALPPLTPGVRTTEFGTHLVVVVVALVTAVGALVHPGYTMPDWVQALLPAVAVIVTAVSQAVYSRGRVKLKAATIAAAGVAVEAHMPEILAAVAAAGATKGATK